MILAKELNLILAQVSLFMDFVLNIQILVLGNGNRLRQSD